jgi:alanine-synthesizing transaminase
MFVWAPLPAQGAHLGSVKFASELLERARVAVSPGVGFGPGGEGFVRFALVEKDDRARRACAAIGEFLTRLAAPAVQGAHAPPVPHIDKAAGLK